MQQHKIVFDNVTKIFKTSRQTITAVKDVSFKIEDGDFVSLIGPSGCGKSTVIRLLDDIIKPTTGDIYIDGEEIPKKKKISPVQIKKMGFIFQQPNLLPWLTVRQNVALPLKVFGLRGAKWEENVDRLIDMVGMVKLSGCVSD